MTLLLLVRAPCSLRLRVGSVMGPASVVGSFIQGDLWLLRVDTMDEASETLGLCDSSDDRVRSLVC